MDPLTVAWLAAIAVWCLFLGLDLRREAAKSRIRSFLWGVESAVGGLDARATGRSLLARVGPRLAAMYPEGEMGNLRQRLAWAGDPYGLTPETFTALRVFLAAAVPAFMLLVSFLQVPGPLVAVGTLAGYMGPSFWLDRRARARQEEIRRRLPAFVDLLAVLLSAGKDLDGTLQEAAERQGGELGREVTLAVQRTATGTPRAHAMREMAARTGVVELSQFVQTIILAEQFGQGIAKNLGRLAEQMRYTRQVQAEKAANQASVKMLLPTIVFIFVPFLLLIGFAACQPLLQLQSF